MARTILTPERRADHVAAVLAARAAGVRDDILIELKGLLQARGYTPVVISSSSTIANGAEDPTVVVGLSGDTFETGIGVSDLEVDPGETELTLDSVTRNSGTQITVGFDGTAAEGTLKLRVKASGLVITPYLPTNTLTFEVPAP